MASNNIQTDLLSSAAAIVTLKSGADFCPRQQQFLVKNEQYISGLLLTIDLSPVVNWKIKIKLFLSK
jgi:hypothetical protein